MINMMITKILLYALVIALIWTLYISFSKKMSKRLLEVASYRIDLLEKIYRLTLEEVVENKYKTFEDACWRVKIFESVSFDKMMFKFWKKVDSFYPKCLLEKKEEDKKIEV